MTADEARELTESRSTESGIMAIALEAVRQSASMGLRSTMIRVPSVAGAPVIANRLAAYGYEAETTYDMVVIKW